MAGCIGQWYSTAAGEGAAPAGLLPFPSWRTPATTASAASRRAKAIQMTRRLAVDGMVASLAPGAARNVDQLPAEERLQRRQGLQSFGLLDGKLRPGIEQSGEIVQHIQEADPADTVGRLGRLERALRLGNHPLVEKSQKPVGPLGPGHQLPDRRLDPDLEPRQILLGRQQRR